MIDAAPSSVDASSGVRSLSDEWGRRRSEKSIHQPIPVRAWEPVAHSDQVDALVRERSPQPLDEDVVHPAALAVQRDANARRCEHVGEVGAGELAALVASEDLGRAIALERFWHGLDAETRIERVGQAPGQHLTACPVHHGDPVQKAPRQGDVGDSCAPHVVRPRDRQIAQQGGIDPVLRVRLRCPGPLEARGHSQPSHQAAHPLARDRVALMTLPPETVPARA